MQKMISEMYKASEKIMVISNYISLDHIDVTLFANPGQFFNSWLTAPFKDEFGFLKKLLSQQKTSYWEMYIQFLRCFSIRQTLRVKE